MSKSTDLTSKIRIIIEIDDPGPGMKQLTEDLAGAKFQIGELTIVQNNFSAATQSTGLSVRGLLLNLRMFSFGVRTLRREFGDTNPALEAISQGLLVLAASGTLVASGFTIITNIAKDLPFITLAFQTVAFAAKTALAAVSLTALAVAGGVLIAIPLLQWWSDQVTGMAALRQEAKALAADLKALEAELDSLTRTQARFNLGMSALSLEMQKLKQAIDLQESGTEAMEARYAAMNAEMANARIQAAEMNLVIQEQNVLTKEGAAIQEDLDRRRRAKQLARGRLAGFIGEEAIFRAMQREGITEGKPTMESIRAVTRDQTAQRMMGGISAPSIIINFPNAQFNTEGDIEGAIISGAEKAGRILYNQYGIPGTQR